MRIRKVTLSNFKGINESQELTGKDLFVGVNGSGKTARLKAITVGLLGYDPEISNASRDVMRHISGDEGGVTLEIEKDDKTTMLIKRTYERTKTGSVKSTVEFTPRGTERNVTDVNARIKAEFGSFTMMYNLSEFMNMTDSEKRDFFFKNCEVKKWDKDKIIKKLAEADNENKMTVAGIVKIIESNWNDNLAIKDNLEIIMSDLKDQRNETQGSLRKLLESEKNIFERKKGLDTTQGISEIKVNIKMTEKAIEEQQKTFNDNLNNKQNYFRIDEKIKSYVKCIKTLEDNGVKANVNYKNDLKRIGTKIDKKKEAMNELKSKLNIIQGNCPLGIKCDKLEKAKTDSENIKNKIESAKDEIIGLAEEEDKFVDLARQQESLLISKNELNGYRAEMKKLDKPIDDDTLSGSIESNKSKLNELQESLEKRIKVNEADELIEKIKLDRTTSELKLEVIKKLEKTAGKEGILQSIIEDTLEPFEEYVNGLFQKINKNISVRFKLVDDYTEKAIFEYGWWKNDKYIPYDALSNGERALFNSALMVALILRNNPKLKILMIDNIEAVDGYNTYIFIKTCMSFKEMDNIILAGCSEANHGEKEGVKIWSLTNSKLKQ